jgi:hypothetical protein
MKKCVRRLAPIAVLALMPMAAMTTPTASSAACDDGQFWSPHSDSCRPLPCSTGASFDPSAGVCRCNFGWRYSPEMNVCQAIGLYAPPVLDR